MEATLKISAQSEQLSAVVVKGLRFVSNKQDDYVFKNRIQM
jgi:hypothetical protein